MYFKLILVLTLQLLGVFNFLAAEEPKFPSASLYNVKQQWTDDRSSSFELQQLQGKNVVTSMMYLSCSASCPITLQKLRSIEKGLEDKGKKAEFVIISFDPKTDSPAEMSKFKAKHKLGANWHFLNGSESDVRKMALLFGFNYQRRGDSIEFDHSNRIILLNPKGEIAVSLESLNAPNEQLLEKAVG